MADESSNGINPIVAADLFQTLVENSLDVITLLNETGQITYVSPAITPVFGYQSEELLNQRGRSFVHPDDQDTVVSLLLALYKKKHGLSSMEVRFRHKDNTWHHIELQAKYIELKNAGQVLVNIRDISKNHAIRVELQQSNELLQTAFHANSNICSISNLKTGEYIDINTAWTSATKWSRSEAINNTSRNMNIWGDANSRKNFLASLMAKNELTQYETIMTTRTGEKKVLLVDAKIIMIADTQCIYFCGSDVTSTRRLENQLRQSLKMEAVGQLTGGVAHDFNNLLSVILGNAELIKVSLDDEDEIAEEIEQIIKATRRGSDLTQQLLAFSRTQTLIPTTVSLNHEIEKTVELLKRSLGENIKIQTNAETNLWPCLIDPGQLQNALLNLALNARDAMPNGGTLNISYTNKVISAVEDTELDLMPGDYICITVSDNGVGILPAEVAQVFEPFFTTKEVGEGTGLGLSMVFGFVKQSGGHVSIESVKWQGTKVIILLPKSNTQTPG
ncbi:MAG: PAS domain S-box protein [Pseudomonadales bacterium]|nr:PAS domain S-box protein [Pseudomonadales bacterium]